MASSDMARRAGYDDALLLSNDGWVLEGPTFGIAWITDGVLETPTLELGILASITRAVAIEAADRVGLAVHEGAFPLERIMEADEVMALSTVKQVTPVGAVDGSELSSGPVTGVLLDTFLDIVAAETGHDPRPAGRP
jgi:branched-subunit amino acid aminotransferase/4-amino-4-deoxychorismate lyase